ncbi:PAP2 superfamily protein, partial [Streptococcus pneumoniae]
IFNEGQFCPFTFRYSWLYGQILPEMLVNFDQSIQTAIRGDLPDYLTILFQASHV